jgi:hypothetical protein
MTNFAWHSSESVVAEVGILQRWSKILASKSLLFAISTVQRWIDSLSDIQGRERISIFDDSSTI